MAPETIHQLFTNPSQKNCRRHGPNSPHLLHRKRARRGDCRTGISRNVNAKSSDLDFGKKCIIFALLRSGLAANARLLRSFLQSMVLQKASRGVSQAALSQNYKALSQNYKALSKNYKALGQKLKGGSSPREEFRRRKSAAKMLPKVINVNATMHFGPSKAHSRPPAGLLRARGLLPHPPLPLQESFAPQLYFTPTCLARINGNYYLCRNLFHTQQNNQQ